MMRIRAYDPVEHLPSEAIVEPHLGACLHCKSQDGNESGGIVKMRANNDFTPNPNKLYCLRCGQRYMLSGKAFALFMGETPPAEKTRRSIFEDWEVSCESQDNAADSS